jgi:hypothetical protein
VDSTQSIPELVTAVIHNHPYLLKEDGEGWTIDLTDLNTIERRSHYLPIGCKVHLTKDLGTATVSGVDGAIQPSKWEQVAQVALNVFTLISEVVLKIVLSVLTSGVLGLRSMSPTSSAVKTLWPFQTGTPQFLERVDRLLLGPGNLLHHLTGFKPESLKAYLVTHARGFLHTIPSPRGLVADLPTVKIGQGYWDALRVTMEDLIAKGAVTEPDLREWIRKTTLPAEWGTVDSVVYILWHITYYLALVKNTLNSFEIVGSFLDSEGNFLTHGGVSVAKAVKTFFSTTSTDLASSLKVVDTPALARKMVSLDQFIVNEWPKGEYHHLRPSVVGMSVA